jgi:hypothetical protein
VNDRSEAMHDRGDGRPVTGSGLCDEAVECDRDGGGGQLADGRADRVGPGGSAYGIRVEDAVGVRVVGNRIFQLSGASGGPGGVAGFGGRGGNGGNGGDGIGISLVDVVGVISSENIIAFFFAGQGGFGAFPGGTNGTPGVAAAMLGT